MLYLRRVLRGYQSFRPFIEPEAWFIFRLAAIAEAFGWTGLIVGVYLRDYVLHGNGVPVTIAGRIHGTLFLAYIFAVIATAPSLGWSWPRTLLAGACSVPPYGSLIYEQLSARLRQRQSLRRFHCWLIRCSTPG